MGKKKVHRIKKGNKEDKIEKKIKKETKYFIF
jgi:hypothetical protein